MAARRCTRRAIRANATPSPALGMMLGALKRHPRLVVEEPVRTAVSLAASAAQQLLPLPVFERCSAYAIDLATRVWGLRV